MSRITTTTVFEISEDYLAESASYDHLNSVLVVALDSTIRIYEGVSVGVAEAFAQAGDLDIALSNLGTNYTEQAKQQ